MKKVILFYIFFHALSSIFFAQSFDCRQKGDFDTCEINFFKKSDTLFHVLAPRAFGVDQRMLGNEEKSKRPFYFRAIPEICMAGQVFKEDYLRGGALGISQLSLESAYRNSLYAQLGGMYFGGQIPHYLQQGMDTLGILPGWGKTMRSVKNGVQAYNWTAHLAYSPNHHFSMEVGHNKLMVGEGYRSLILSRNSAPYYFARATIKAGNFRLYSIWCQLRDIQNGWGAGGKKYVALHGLNWKITPKFQLTLHEMVTWQRNDSTSVRNLDIHYLNPLLFWRPVEYAQGSADNVLLAMSGSYIHRQKVKFYFQFLLDEWLLSAVRARNGWWGLKYGGQLGVKYLEIFPGFSGLSEINVVRPFTYSHASSLQAWGQLNQPLAHPTGANFVEWVNKWQYKKEKWTLHYQINYNVFGRNTGNKNYGGDIFMTYMNPVSQYGNTLFQGEKHYLMYQQLSVSRSLGVLGEAFVQLGWRNDYTSLHTASDQWIMLGWRTQGFQWQPWDY